MTDYNVKSVLTEPEPETTIPNLVNSILTPIQYISVTYWVDWVLDKVTGVNPAEWVGEQYAGDWEAAGKAGTAMEKLGQFNEQYAQAIEAEMKNVFTHEWQGNAADAAREYFEGVAKTLKEQVQALESIGKQFNTIATGMKETGEAIKGLLETLMDLVIAAAVEAAAAAASSWTVIGPILSGAAFLVTIDEAIGVWGKVLKVHSAAGMAVEAFVGVCAGYLGGLQGLEQHQLAGTAYDHPGV
jgi:uncharacterized protein YukE